METFLQSGELFGCFCAWFGCPLLKFWEDMVETDSLRCNKIACHRSFSPYSRLTVNLCQVHCRLSELECFDQSPRKECHVVKIDLTCRSIATLDPSLTELPDLEVFDLAGIWSFSQGVFEVGGNIKVFENSKKLRYLNLHGTKVQGTLAALKNSKELRYLNLGRTYVSGSLTALKNATRLKKLNLQYTNVDGDVMALENATELTHLDLPNTHVVGDVSRLRPLENCDVSGTRISCKGQDEPLRQILLQLGLKAGQLTNLKKVAGIGRRMLSCRYEVFFLSFFIYIHMVWLGTSKHVWKLAKLHHA